MGIDILISEKLYFDLSWWIGKIIIKPLHQVHILQCMIINIIITIAISIKT